MYFYFIGNQDDIAARMNPSDWDPDPIAPDRRGMYAYSDLHALAYHFFFDHEGEVLYERWMMDESKLMLVMVEGTSADPTDPDRPVTPERIVAMTPVNDTMLWDLVETIKVAIARYREADAADRDANARHADGDEVTAHSWWIARGTLLAVTGEVDR